MRPADKLATALAEVASHSTVLVQALAEWQASPATTWPALENERAQVRLVDQILFRFIKLQDAVGERLIPATLASLREPFEESPMRDRLNRLEKLGFLDVDSWLFWREVRNRLAHEYPDQPELRFAALLAAIEAAQGLVALCQSWRNRLQTE